MMTVIVSSVVTFAVVVAMAVLAFTLTAGYIVVMTSAVIPTVAALMLALTASYAGIIASTVIPAVAALMLTLAAIHAGVVTDAIVVAMTALTFAVTTPIIATLHPIHGCSAVSDVCSAISNGLMD